jgi:hypothetical protein
MRFAQANFNPIFTARCQKVSRWPPEEEERPVWERVAYTNPEGNYPVVVQYLVYGKTIDGVLCGAGHTWNGRSLEESEFSKEHGRPLPPELFDTIGIFAKEWGW